MKFNKFNKINKNHLLFIGLSVILLVILFKNYLFGTKYPAIESITDKWIHLVTVEKDPQKIYNLFCDQGILLGTVSQIERKGKDIEKYFDYFAKLPELKVLHKNYSIEKITSDTFVNNAWITWLWKGLEKPIVARMTFIFKKTDNKWCLFELHSSALPDENKKLLDISGKK